MLGSRVFHSPWRARARSFDSTLSFIICVVCVCVLRVYTTRVWCPNFLQGIKGTRLGESESEIEKIFLDDLSAVCVRALLLPKTAFEKKNRIFFFLNLSCVQHFLPLRWLFLLCRLLSPPPPRFAVIIIIIIIIKTERRQKEEEKEDDSMLKACVKKEEDARDLHERGRDAKMMMMLMMKKVVIIISRTERCSK